MAVSSSIPLDEISVGESISCDGCCLTVVSKEKERFIVEASQETAARTILRHYRIGAVLNIERALRADGRLGGHFVTGHVDCTGQVDSLKPVGESLELAVGFDIGFDPLVVDKGSIAVNGVSLTVNRCRSGWFSVNLVPHTVGKTNLSSLRKGTSVNLEFDLIGKYIARMNQAGPKIGLTKERIIQSGW